MNRDSKLRAGEWVEVRSKEEILKTLDKRGQLESLPFMPEMFQYCGQRFKVFKRAHKTCDPPNGMQGRRMLDAVHLEGLRCDGQAHGGCEAGCLIFWKEAWLRRVSADAQSGAGSGTGHSPAALGPVDSQGCTMEEVLAGTRAPGEPMNSANPTFVCQSTHWVSVPQCGGRTTVFKNFEAAHPIPGGGAKCARECERPRRNWICDQVKRFV